MPLMRKYRDLEEFDAAIAANDIEDQRRADEHSVREFVRVNGGPEDAVAPLRGKFEHVETFRQFILAGKATFTMVSRKTGERLTFLARRPKPDPLRGSALRPVWLSVLTGPNNTTDYGFLGTLWVKSSGAVSYRPGSQTAIGPEAPSQRAAQWLADGLSSPAGYAILLRHAEFWHEGRCGRCGRKLTVPESIAAGFGPECAGLV